MADTGIIMSIGWDEPVDKEGNIENWYAI